MKIKTLLINLLFVALFCGCESSGKLHRYYKAADYADMHKERLSFLSFSGGRLELSRKAIAPHVGYENEQNISGFYSIDIFRFEDLLWNSENKDFHNSLIGYLKTFAESDAKKCRDLLGKDSMVSAYKKNYSIIGRYHQSDVGVYPFLSLKKIEDDNSKSVLDLSAVGQKEYISKLPNSDHLIEDVFKEAEDKSGSGSSEKFQLVISTQNLCSEPGDRIVKAYHRILSRDLCFKNWEDVKFSWSTIDLGSQTDEINNELSIGDTIKALSLGYKLSKNVSETFNYKKRYVSLAGSISKNQILLYQEGEPGIDLSGSLIFKVDIVPNKETPKEDRVLLLASTYTIRHIYDDKGVRTMMEGDDKVEYVTFTVIKPYRFSFFMPD